MSVGQKLAMFKIRATRMTFLSLCDLESAPEEAMQLRRLIKSSNESLGLICLGNLRFAIFRAPEMPRGSPGYSTSKSLNLIIGLNLNIYPEILQSVHFQNLN